ncbi:MAG: DUF6259 domain-containing protein [Pirellulaceae bacterium]
MAHSITRTMPTAKAFSPTALVGGLLLWFLPAVAWGQGPAALNNGQLRIEIDRSNGAITRIVDKEGQLHLTPVEGLADNFRLLLRSADKKKKVILGRSQKLSALSANNNGLDLAWDGPLTDSEGGTHNLRVRMEIRLIGLALEFRLHCENDTADHVAEASYPLIGGLTRFGREQDCGETAVMLPTSSPTIKKVAIPWDEVALSYPGQMNMSFSSVYNSKAGRAMYFAAHDTVARLKYYRFFEESSPAGKDVFACIQHVPFVAPGKRFEGSPVILRFYDGTWMDAGPIYREWFTQTFGLIDPSQSWIRCQPFIQDTMFLLPEGTLNYTFHDIPRWAQDARDHGITAVLISGWHRGGHDNGYPHYEPDPRLGTYDDLRRGIEACHKMGVRVYFFINYQPAMTESEWFTKELHNYVEMREDGGYGACGWGMGTLWARMGHPKPMTWVDPSFPAYREALLRQFLKLVEVGADGLHVDKMFPTPLNFNPRCELGPDTSTWEGAIRLTRTLCDEARNINPEFAVSFECNWDRMLEFGSAIWWVGNMSLARSVFPEMIETRPITSPYDYLGINNAVRLSQVGLVGPLNYSRSVGWEPWKGLAEYLREVKQIQDKLSEAVFFGEVLGHAQIELGHEPGPGIEYNVFRGLKTLRRVCVLTNSDMEERSQVVQAFAGNRSGRVRVHLPFAASQESVLPIKVIVPGERLLFVEELSGPSGDADVPPSVESANLSVPPATNVLNNGGFESGDFTGWTADPNWCVDRNTCGAYRGWEGDSFAWSGGRGEAATGCLKSKPFVLDSDGVRLLVAGWNNAPGSSRCWNYVMLKAADGTEIDRRGAPNNLNFTRVLLDGAGHKGETVYIEAVDDADQAGFSMFCIDDVRMITLPSSPATPLEPPSMFDDTTHLKLENERYRIEVSRSHGTVTRILDKSGRLELIREPRLAGNYKFTLPLPGKEPWQTIDANYILGDRQSLSSFDLEGQRLTLRWLTPLTSRTGEKYDVGAVMGIALEGDAVRLTLQVENNTPYKIGEIFFPVLGGMTGFGRTLRELRSTTFVRPAGSGAESSDVFFHFTNSSGLGDQGPEQFYTYPQDLLEPWLELHNRELNRSMYMGAHDLADRSQVLHLELLPGNAETSRLDGNWPRPQELNGLPVGVRVSFVEFADHPPGKVYEAAPVILQVHDGGWQEGQRIYRTWKSSR